MALLRSFESFERDPEIDRWFDEREPELGTIARRWFGRIRESGADVRELMHDGCPGVCVADVAFAYVNVFRAHVNVGFFQGANLPDPAGMLEGSGKRMRHVKLRPDIAIDEVALDALIDAAYVDIEWRLQSE